MTILPKASPECSRAKASATRLNGYDESITGRTPGRRTERQQLGQLAGRAHRGAQDLQLHREDPAQVDRSRCPPVAPETTIRAIGAADFIEWSKVAAPTVSITTSTRSGSRAPGSSAVAPSAAIRSRLRGVAAGRVHPLAQRDGERDGGGGHAAAGALDQHALRRRRRRPLVVSMR